MSLVADIAEAYTAPRQVAVRRLPASRRDDLTFKALVLAGLLMTVATTPVAVRDTMADGTAAFYAWLFWLGVLFVGIQPFVSLAFSGCVALGFWLARRGREAHRVRAAWAWALLAASPVYLVAGVVSGLFGRALPVNPSATVCLFAVFFFFAAALSARRPSGVRP